MPVPKRYFKLSHEINHDPEVWELTTLFGDRSLRLWMQFLASFDKTDNQFKLSGLWVSQLAKVTKLNLQTVVKATFWMIDRGWITIIGDRKLAEEWSEIGRRLTGDWPKNHRRLAGDLPETHRRMIEEWSEIGRRLSLCASNHAKYNRTQEQKRNVHVPLLTNPTPNQSLPTPKDKEKREEKKAAPSRKLTDEEFLGSLKANPAYAHIDFSVEVGKMDAWLILHPGRQKTRKFIVNWLNKVDRPMRVGSGAVAHAAIPPFPPANDPIGRGMWRRAYGDPPKAEA